VAGSGRVGLGYGGIEMKATRSSTGLWLTLGALALLAVIAFVAIMAATGGGGGGDGGGTVPGY
jgi:hypothetical protein